MTVRQLVEGVAIATLATCGAFALLRCTLLLVRILITNHRRALEPESSALREAFADPRSPGVTLVVRFRDHERVAVQAVNRLLDSYYPAIEVVVIDDASSDSTFDRLCSSFDLVKREDKIEHLAVTVPIERSIFTSRRALPLVVVRHEFETGDVDSLNVALNIARHPLLCVVDPTVTLHREAIATMVRRLLASAPALPAVAGLVEPGRRRPPTRARARWTSLLDLRTPVGVGIGGLLVSSKAVIDVGRYDGASIADSAEFLRRTTFGVGRHGRFVLLAAAIGSVGDVGQSASGSRACQTLSSIERLVGVPAAVVNARRCRSEEAPFPLVGILIALPVLRLAALAASVFSPVLGIWPVSTSVVFVLSLLCFESSVSVVHRVARTFEPVATSASVRSAPSWATLVVGSLLDGVDALAGSPRDIGAWTRAIRRSTSARNLQVVP